MFTAAAATFLALLKAIPAAAEFVKWLAAELHSWDQSKNAAEAASRLDEKNSAVDAAIAAVRVPGAPPATEQLATAPKPS
jgi:isoaspartyl peptidase/L-asparaginase-like protein (Ntn-hydrolase superfamily)